MPKIADDYTVFKKNSNGNSVWCVYYRDPITGDRFNAISLQKIKRLLNKGRKGKEPIKDRDEAIRLAERAYGNKKMQDLVFHKKKKKEDSILLVDFVESVWNYESSEYIKERIAEGNPIEKSTCVQNYNCFVKYGEPIISKSLTLGMINEDDGKSLVEIRRKIVSIKDISNSHKNKILQALRTAMNYAYKKRIVKKQYADCFKNCIPHKKDGKTDEVLSVDDVKHLIAYLNEITKRNSYDRWKYLVCAVSAITGMREGEVLALKKKNILFPKNADCAVLEVSNAIKASGEYGSLKENRGIRNIKKYVGIYSSLANEMLSFCKQNPKYESFEEGEQYIFWSDLHNTKPISNDKVKRVIPNAVKNSKIERKERNITFKWFRSFNATVIKNSDDCKMAVAKNQLGHYSVSTTDVYYARETEEGAINRFSLIKENLKFGEAELLVY